MKVVYADQRTCRLCTVQRVGQAEFGEAGWKRLKLRIKELEASAGIEELLEGPGSWHLLTRDRNGCHAGKVTGTQRIIVEPAGGSDPDPGGVTVRVIEIVDYH